MPIRPLVDIIQTICQIRHDEQVYRKIKRIYFQRFSNTLLLSSGSEENGKQGAYLYSQDNCYDVNTIGRGQLAVQKRSQKFFRTKS